MLTDPRRPMSYALAALAAASLWFVALAVDDAALFARFDMVMHAITFLAIFVAVAAGVAALIFRRFAQVRDELLAGRREFARWRVDEATLRAVAPKALAEDVADKRGALFAVWFFVALIFGGFAIADPAAAPGMLAVAATLAVGVGVAYLFGRRVVADHWRWRGGEAIVGERGLMFNGVLHVWAVPLSWLQGARLSERPAALRVVYRHLSRAGVQSVEALIPVPANARAEAERALAGLSGRRRKVAAGGPPPSTE